MQREADAFDRQLNPKVKAKGPKLKEEEKKNLAKKLKDIRTQVKAMIDELEETPDRLRRTIEVIQRGEAQAEQARRSWSKPTCASWCQSPRAHESRIAVSRSDSGRQHRPDEGGGQVRVSSRVQVFDVRHVVDSAGHHTRDCRPGADDPHSGPHDRDDQQADSHIARARAGTRSRAHLRGNRQADGYSGRKVRKVLKIAQEPISLETPIGEEEDSHLGDFIEDRNIVSPAEAVINLNLKEQTEAVLKTLTPREEKVIKMRFGVGDGSEHTLEEVGQNFADARTHPANRSKGAPEAASPVAEPQAEGISGRTHLKCKVQTGKCKVSLKAPLSHLLWTLGNGLKLRARRAHGGPVAQRLERPAHNRLVPGSNPGGPTQQ